MFQARACNTLAFRSERALGDASTPGAPAVSIAASVHGGTYSHVAVAGGTWGGESPTGKNGRKTGLS